MAQAVIIIVEEFSFSSSAKVATADANGCTEGVSQLSLHWTTFFLIVYQKHMKWLVSAQHILFLTLDDEEQWKFL